MNLSTLTVHLKERAGLGKQEDLDALIEYLQTFDVRVRALGIFPAVPEDTETQVIYRLIREIYDLSKEIPESDDASLRFMQQVSLARREYEEKKRRRAQGSSRANKIAAGVAGASVFAAIASVAGAAPDMPTIEVPIRLPQWLEEIIPGENDAGDRTAGAAKEVPIDIRANGTAIQIAEPIDTAEGTETAPVQAVLDALGDGNSSGIPVEVSEPAPSEPIPYRPATEVDVAAHVSREVSPAPGSTVRDSVGRANGAQEQQPAQQELPGSPAQSNQDLPGAPTFSHGRSGDAPAHGVNGGNPQANGVGNETSTNAQSRSGGGTSLHVNLPAASTDHHSQPPTSERGRSGKDAARDRDDANLRALRMGSGRAPMAPNQANETEPSLPHLPRVQGTSVAAMPEDTTVSPGRSGDAPAHGRDDAEETSLETTTSPGRSGDAPAHGRSADSSPSEGNEAAANAQDQGAANSTIHPQAQGAASKRLGQKAES